MFRSWNRKSPCHICSSIPHVTDFHETCPIDGAMGGPTGGRQRPWVAFWPWPLSIAVHVGLLALGSWLGDWKSHFFTYEIDSSYPVNTEMDGTYYFEF